MPNVSLAGGNSSFRFQFRLVLVVSGSFNNFSRDGIKESIEKNGGKLASSISKKTSFVIDE